MTSCGRADVEPRGVFPNFFPCWLHCSGSFSTFHDSEEESNMNPHIPVFVDFDHLKEKTFTFTKLTKKKSKKSGITDQPQPGFTGFQSGSL